MANMTKPYSGRCLCGAVAYEVRGDLSNIHACHCEMCRRQSGHFVASANAKRSDFSFTQERGLKWYRSSEWAERGFCSECGSALFWDDGGDDVGINVGSLDQPTGLTLKSHIFVDEKADYYEIDDQLPKFAGYDKPLAPE
jgi:hypothetical protein